MDPIYVGVLIIKAKDNKSAAFIAEDNKSPKKLYLNTFHTLPFKFNGILIISKGKFSCRGIH